LMLNRVSHCRVKAGATFAKRRRRCVPRRFPSCHVERSETSLDFLQRYQRELSEILLPRLWDQNDNIVGCAFLPRTFRRGDSHAFVFELRSQFTHELDRAGRVAVNTNRLSTYIDIAALDGAHFALAQHSQDALGGFFWIAEQCVRSRARNKPSIIQVIAISENFARDLQTVRFASAGKLSVVRRE